MDLVLKNARVIDTLHNIDGIFDIAIDDGKIADIGKDLSGGKKLVDLSGKTIMPGVIDMHVHVTELLGGRVGYKMAAKTGVTTLVDFAGPVKDIVENAGHYGCGLNIGCLNVINPQECGTDPSKERLEVLLDESLEWGALGLKILGGHFPLTPQASRAAIEVANENKTIVAFHSGTTESRSDFMGYKDSIEAAKGHRLIIPHINAYCRGKYFPVLDEIRQAFDLLRENGNIIADSHLAVANGTSGLCENGHPHDLITENCLKMFNYEPTEAGLEKAISDGTARVIVRGDTENYFLERKEALAHWRGKATKTDVSFPANNPIVAVACALERKTPGGDFLIPMAATDGGGFPRNDLIGKMLSLYHLGYISLHDVIRKVSLNPAKVFGLYNKGTIAKGADADLTILNETLTKATESYANGKQIMKDGEIFGSGGCLIATKAGEAKAKSHGLSCTVTDLSESAFYKGF